LNVPGKYLITADAESKAPLTDFPNSEEGLYKTADVYTCEIQAILDGLAEKQYQKILSPTVKLLQIFQK